MTRPPAARRKVGGSNAPIPRRALRIALGALLGLGALASPVRAAYETVAVTDGGVLTGTVRFAGTPPRLEPLRVNKNREVCGESKGSEALIVGPEGGVAGSVVLIEGVPRGKKAEDDLVIDNHRCLFVPHVSAVMSGMRVRLKNSDPVLHNTHGLRGGTLGPKKTLFNLALPNVGQTIEITRRLGGFGPVRLLCDAHTHMLGWVYVHDSPYIAVTDARGAFRIPEVPPGRYRVTMWHEAFRPRSVDRDGRPVHDEPQTVTKEVAIGAGATATVEFELR
jgi:Carboxypeptidase regulatory-like domain